MEKKKNIIFPVFLFTLGFLAFFGGKPLSVFASEINYPDTEERVNLLELRLEEFGTSVSEIQARLENAEVFVNDTVEENLKISQQLDVLIVGLDELNKALPSFLEHGEKSMDSLSALEKTGTLFNEKQEKITALTVSGNDILSNLGTTVTESIKSNSQQSIDELTKVLSNTNSMLVKLYCMLFALIVLIIIDVLYRFLWNRLFKHAFD